MSGLWTFRSIFVKLSLQRHVLLQPPREKITVRPLEFPLRPVNIILGSQVIKASPDRLLADADEPRQLAVREDAVIVLQHLVIVRRLV